jgi:deoxyribodipyrimidine photolyase-related protein
MSAFRDALAAHPPAERPRRWHYLPWDQLSPAFLTAPPDASGVVLLESAAKARRRPYHRQKLALVLANQRHFAVELARSGVAVRYLSTDDDPLTALTRVIAELGPLLLAEPAERELRAELAPRIADGGLILRPHPGWLTTDADGDVACPPSGAWKMDNFYRHVRRRTGVLMVDGEPEGGRLSFDVDNRQRWDGAPPAPTPPTFTPDAITAEVGALIERKFADHPGRLDLTSLPTTADDAERLWAWAKTSCLPRFGPFEDAMSRRSTGLFHSRISPLLNVHRLWPDRIVREVAAMDAPIASREGFVRQILGWREFVRHVHRRTDGFRTLANTSAPVDAPGDGGWSRHAGRPWPRAASHGVDGGAAPNLLRAEHPVPPALWGARSGLRCLDEVVRSVWDEGWSHHITRLMVVGNLMTLLGVSPRDLADWFWVAYIDAYDWVVEPNVLAMATFGTDRMTTKPYVSGAPYLAKMSDYCQGCRFDPKTTCPITPMYWAFLADHQDLLRRNPRTAGPVASLARRSPERLAEDQRIRAEIREKLLAGQPVDGAEPFKLA